MEQKMYFFGTNGYIELYGYSLWILTIDRTVPTLLIDYEISSRIFGMLACDLVYTIFDL